MSRSYKRNPWWKNTDKDAKKAFNRRLRRSNSGAYVDVPNGNAYRKRNQQCELRIERCYHPWESFRHRNLKFFDSEEEAYIHWRHHYEDK